MTNYTKQITQAFYKQNPDKLKLDRGCEIYFPHGDVTLTMSEEGDLIKSSGYTAKSEYGEFKIPDIYYYGETGDRSQESKDMKILGSPITTLQAISLFGEDEDVSQAWLECGTGTVRIKYTSDKGDRQVIIDPSIALFKDQKPEVQKKVWELLDLDKEIVTMPSGARITKEGILPIEMDEGKRGWNFKINNKQ